MALNIKDDRIHEQARSLALREGCSVTDVVRRALAEYEVRHPSAEEVERRMAAIRVIQQDYRAAAAAGFRPLREDDLYGEDGLPA